MDILGFHLEVKESDGQGRFRGVASTYTNIDRAGERVAPGAFTRTLREGGPERPLLWSHNAEQAVGLARLSDSAEGLIVDGALDLDTQAGREAYSRVKKRIARGLSIGYLVTKDAIRDGFRELLDLDLLEVSLTAIPANPLAVVNAVKQFETPASAKDFQRILHEGMGFSRRQAAAVCTKGWSGLTDAGGDDEAELAEWLRQAAQIPKPNYYTG